MVAASGIGCSVQSDSGKIQENVAGTSQHISTPLNTPPTFNSTTGIITVTVTDETAELYVNAADSSLMINSAPVYDTTVTPEVKAIAAAPAAAAAGATATATTSTVNIKKIVIADVNGGSGDNVILDYTNGLFGQGTSSAVGTTVTLLKAAPNAWSKTNTLVVKGTTGDDNFALGGTGGLNGGGFISLTNGGTTPVKDISFTYLQSLTFDLGEGDDTFTAAGSAATGSAFNGNLKGTVAPMPVAIYGGPGDDTLFEGTETKAQVLMTPGEVFSGGDGTDTIDYSGRLQPVSVVIDPTAAVAPVDTSTGNVEFLGAGGGTCLAGGTNAVPVACTGLSAASLVNHTSGAGPLSVALEGATKSTGVVDLVFDINTPAKDFVSVPALAASYIDPTLGAAEGDIILDVEIVKTGSGGNQIMGGPGGNSYSLQGGTGNDTFVQGSDSLVTNVGMSNDTMAGNGGVDTIDYSQRTGSLNVIMDGVSSSGEGSMGEADIVGADIQNLYLGTGGGLYTGNSLNNIFYSAKAATAMSIVNGGPGDDILEEGGDAYNGSQETFNGGPGNDTVDYSSRTGSVFVIMDGTNPCGTANLTWDGPATGEDYLTAAPVVTEGDIISATDVENVIGSQGRDLIIGNSLANSLQGNGSSDAKYGDTLCGMGGQDELVGNAATGVGKITSLHGYDCPWVVSVTGAHPAAGDHKSADTTESVPNSCYNIGPTRYSTPDLSAATNPNGWSAATVGLADNCSLSAE
jgi:hypothetical protein